MFPPEKISRRICPAHQVLVLDAPASIPADWALVPTEEELLAADRARNAFKADQRWFDLTVHFAHSEEVQRDRSRA